MKAYKNIRCVGAIVTTVLLTGCAALSNWQADQKRRAWENGADFCGRKHFEPFMGTDFDKLVIPEHHSEKYLLRIIDKRIPDGIVTTELRYNRLNIQVSQQGVIEEIRCY